MNLILDCLIEADRELGLLIDCKDVPRLVASRRTTYDRIRRRVTAAMHANEVRKQHSELSYHDFGKWC